MKEVRHVVAGLRRLEIRAMNLPRDVVSGELRILIVEDQVADAELCRKELKRAGLRFSLQCVATRKEFEAALEKFRPDLIISDFTLPGAFDGLLVLDLARKRFPGIPVLFVSGTIGEERAVEAMKRGAADYVLKDRMARLGPAVRQIIEKRQLRADVERAEAALRANEALYRGIFEGSAEGILLFTLEGYLLGANPAAARMLGYDSQEKMLSGVTNPGQRLYADPHARREFFDRVKQEGEVLGFETRGMRKDGTPLWVTLSARLIRDQEGGAARILTMISDISERKRADEFRSNLVAIVENSNDAIIGRSLDGTITTWNAGAERMLGYSAGEAIGRPISFMLPPGQPVRTAEINEKVLRGEAIPPHETRRVSQDGREIEVLSSVSPIRDSDGRITGASHILRDITAVKRAEETLRAMFDQAGVGIGLRSLEPRNPRWLRVNQKLCDIFGYSEQELLQLTTVELTPPEERGLAIDYNEKLRTGELTNYSREKRYLRKDGRIIWANISLAALRSPEGRPTHVISVIEDVTERKLQQQRIEKLSRTRAVSSGISATLVRVHDRQELLRESCRIAVEDGQFPFAWIGLLDPQTQDVTPVAWGGVGSDDLTRAKSSARSDSPRGMGAVGHAIRERRPVINNDIAARQFGGPRVNEILKLGFRSQITLPLFVDELVIGTLTIYAREPNFFDQEELKLLTGLASNISFALEDIAKQQKLDKLSRIRAVSSEVNAAIVRAREYHALLEETCRIASEHGGIPMVWIGAVDAEKQMVQPVVWTGFSAEAARAVSWASISAAKGTLGEAAHTRKAAVRDDIEAQLPAGKLRQEALALGCLSTICLPLLVENKVTALAALFAPGRGFFDEDERALLNELAGNISFGLENIAQQEKIAKLSRLRAVSSEINAVIVRVREREALLREACRIATEHGKFEFVWVASVDQEKQLIQPVAWAGFDPETAQAVRWASLNAPGVTLAEVMRTKRLAVRNDIETEQSTGILRGEAAKKGCRSTVCLPFVVDEEVVAAMILFAAGQNFFVEDELTLLEEVAANISIALERMARQEKIEKLSRVRAVSSELNAAIVRIRDRRELFAEACRIAVEHGKFVMAWIGTIDETTQSIRVVAKAGSEEDYLERVKLTIDTDTTKNLALAVEAVARRAPVVCNDIATDGRMRPWRSAALERGYRANAMLPLLLGERVIGIFGLYAPEPGFFDSEELNLLVELVGDVSFALDHIEKQEKLDYLAYYDMLTGLPNRTLFLDRVGQQMRTRSGEPLMTALILANIERFRNINETLGRDGGDELLKQVARRFEGAFHGKDYLARIGADGFGVVMRGIRDTAAVVHAVESQVLGCFHEPFKVGDSELRVAARTGIALHPADGADAGTLFNNAEAALKKARDSGEHYLFYASDMNARAAQMLSLETRLRKAVEARQFVLHYQPKINLSNGAICGMEALIRWNDPESGLVAPGTFIPLLEETGLILEVGKWALAQALADHRDWGARGCAVLPIAVNVSAIQLQQKDFSEVVISAVQQGGGRPEALELEITESLLMKDIEASIRKLSILRGLGVHIAMDDFGTGYSSLSYITRLPINSVKIDRSFISGMARSPQDMGIVTTIIALAHSLNLRVVAEGVETSEQSQLLKLLKCDEAQGYLYSKPLPAADIEPKLRDPAPPTK